MDDFWRMGNMQCIFYFQCFHKSQESFPPKPLLLATVSKGASTRTDVPEWAQAHGVDVRTFLPTPTSCQGDHST